MSAQREANFLSEFVAVVVGETAASDTVIAVLSALGATVERSTSLDGDLSDADAIIVDRIAEGIDEQSMDRIARLGGEEPSQARVLITISAFGMDGPRSWYRGSELVAAAAGCLLAAVRDTSGTVHQMPASQALRTVGQAAALATLHGLSLSRVRDGVVHLDVSAQEAVAFASVQQELAHVMYNCPGQGGSARYAAPSRLFECTDGFLNIVVIDDHQFARVAALLGRPDWVENYPTVAERNEHADEINGVVAEWAGARSKVECEELLQQNSVPATAIRAVAEAGRSAQFVARKWPYGPETTTRTTGVVPALVQRRGRAAAVKGRSLADLHVVEVTNVLAGPLAGAIVGAMGATVLRLEDRERLDVYRRNGPFADGEPGLERAAYFMAANYDKRSVSESLGDPETAADIMTWGDVLLENVGQGRLDRLGVHGSQLSGDGTGCSISVSGFGRSGPHSHFRAYAWNVHSYAGLSEAVTEHVGAEVKVQSALADYCSAMWAATFGAAWWLGGGADSVTVDLSMAEVIASKLLPPEDPDRTAGVPGTASPRDLVVPLDGGGFLAATVSDPGKVLAALGEGGPVDGNVEEAVLGALGDAAAKDPEAVVDALQKAGVPAYVMQTPASLIEDPQAVARDSFPEVDHPVLGRRRIIALPWKVAGEPRSGYRAAPLLGEADADVERVVRQ